MSEYHNIGEESKALCMVTVGVTQDGTVFPIRCKRWACPICAPINALHEAIRTANGVSALRGAGLLVKFVTFTQLGKVKTPEFAYRILDSQWDKFRNRWQYWAREQGVPNFYAAFVEGQSRRAGMPHFHILATSLPKAYRVKLWGIRSGLGYMCDVQAVGPSSGVAWYVSKYSTKSTDAQYMPHGFRRVRYSEDWPKMIFQSDLSEGESVVKEPRESYAHWLLRAVAAFDVDPDETMSQLMALVDLTENVEISERVAQTYLITT